MSLITDALRAAQQEKERRQPAGAARRAVVDGFLAVDRRGNQRERRRSVLLGFGSAGVVTSLLATVAFVLPRLGGPIEAAPAAPAPGIAIDPSSLRSDPVAVEEPPIEATPEAAAAADEAPDDAASLGGEDEVVQADADVAATDTAPAPPVTPLPSSAMGAASTATMTASTAAETPPMPAVVAPPMVEITMPPIVEVRSAGSADESSRLLTEAVDAYNRNDLAGARLRYEEITARWPDNADAHNNYGVLLRKAGELARAEAEFKMAVDLNPEHSKAWNNLGSLYTHLDRLGEAVAALGDALKRDPESTSIRVNLATALHKQKKLNEARVLLEETLARSPELAEAHYELGRVLEDLELPLEAAEHYDRFLIYAQTPPYTPAQKAAVRQQIILLRGGGAE